MGVCELSIEEGEASASKVSNEVDKADLARVGTSAIGAREHGFAGEEPSEGDSIEPPDENRSLVCGEPGFDGVCMPGAVEHGICVANAMVDPGLAAGTSARLAARFDHGVEGGVCGDGEAAAADALGKRSRDSETVERDDATSGRVEPMDFARVGVGHGKEALGVCGEDRPDEVVVDPGGRDLIGRARHAILVCGGGG